MNKWARDELLNLPVRKWDTESTYDTIILLPSLLEHDSGWGCITIIGANNGEPVEIVTQHTDDIEWRFSRGLPIRTDCLLESDAIHMWSAKGERFTVGIALSSINITVSYDDNSNDNR